MSDQDEEFQQRWGFRRTESDLDSSSDDHSRPSSPSEPKLKKHKLIFSEENNQETIDIESDPEAEVRPSSEPNEEPSQSCKDRNPKSKGTQRQRKARSRNAKMATDHKPSDAPLNDLRCYTESLIQGIKVAREDFLKWMSTEMGEPIQDDMIPSKPNGKGRGLKQNPRRSKSVRNNPKKGRRKSGTTTQKQEAGASEKSVKGKTVVSHRTEEDFEPPKEPENCPTGTTTIPSTEKQKRKKSGPSVNKPKIPAPPADDQPTSKSAVVALPAPTPASAPALGPAPAHTPTPSYLTLPTVLPRPQVENAERNPAANSNEREFGKRNALTSGINLNPQLSCFPRAQAKDGVFAQSGLRNVNDYEQNTGLTIGNVRVNGNGNGSGSGFPFSLHPQALSGGIGIQNPGQFGMQFLSQDNRMPGLRMNGGPTRFPSGNPGFLESYGALNQHLRFKSQGGALGLQCPDIRGTNLQPRQ